MEIQIVDWQTYDCADDDGDEEDFDEEEDTLKYIIHIFGVDKNNQSVSLKVTGFKPRFYVNIPKNWTDIKINTFINLIKDKVNRRFKTP